MKIQGKDHVVEESDKKSTSEVTRHVKVPVIPQDSESSDINIDIMPQAESVTGVEGETGRHNNTDKEVETETNGEGEIETDGEGSEKTDEGEMINSFETVKDSSAVSHNFDNNNKTYSCSFCGALFREKNSMLRRVPCFWQFT